MNFELTKEQRLIKETVKEFAEHEIKPIVREMNEQKRIPNHIIKGLAEIGVLGMTFSPEYGGISADPITCGIVAEELARVDYSCAIPTFFLVQNAWGYILDKFGRKTAKEAILPFVTKGEAFLGIACTEPDCGSDLVSMKTIAKKTGDKYIINGEKMFITGVKEATSQLTHGGGYLTLTKTDPEKGARGMSLFYIPVKDKEGIRITLLEEWGREGISSGGIAFENVEVPKDFLVGEENRGFYIVMQGFDYARALISVVCCSAGMSALEEAMKYIKERRAFGQPIGRFEGIQFKLAEHYAKLDAIKLLAYKALWMYGKEQEGKFSRFEVTKICAEAKSLAPQFAFSAINDAIQWFGAMGYTTDCTIELALRGVRSYFWAEGALEIMKIIVARELLGKDYVAYR